MFDKRGFRVVPILAFPTCYFIDPRRMTMAKLVALYKKPADAAAFNAYYFGTHAPIAKRVPGLRGYEVSAGPIATPQGDSPYHLAAILSFDSAEALQRGLGSSEGQAAAGDLANFAQAGVDLLIFESKEA
jgi:uncharacterized protein (TIGR02118 family)